MSLFIGAFFPEPDLSSSPFSAALTNIAVKLATSASSKSIARDPLIDLRFLLPGKLDKPGFTGMRLNSFDKTSNTLRIDSSVPEGMIESNKAADYIIAAMHDATENAGAFFQENNIDFNEFLHLQIVQRLDNSQE